MEEIAKFQDLHKDSFNETVESLIILYKVKKNILTSILYLNFKVILYIRI